MSNLASIPDLDLIDTESGLHTLYKSNPLPEYETAHTLLTKEMARRGLFFSPLAKAKIAGAVQDGDEDDETSPDKTGPSKNAKGASEKVDNTKKSADGGSGGGDSGLVIKSEFEDGWVKAVDHEGGPFIVTKRDYTAAERRAAANSGHALPDGSFPIHNEADLHNAIRLASQASNPDAAKEHIIARAAAMGMQAALPDDWQAEDSSKSKPKATQPTKKSAGDKLYQWIKDTLTSKADKEVDEFLKSLEEDGDPDIPTHDYAVVKSFENNRYTLGPVYMPNKLDAHDEWASASDLQQAMWGYVKKTAGNRNVYLQHSKLPAGEWVEIMTWPMEVTTTLTKSVDGVEKSEEHTFPAGTCYMGVCWEPWAWEEVKEGGITGFSMGGRARRVEAIPET